MNQNVRHWSGQVLIIKTSKQKKKKTQKNPKTSKIWLWQNFSLKSAPCFNSVLDTVKLQIIYGTHPSLIRMISIHSNVWMGLFSAFSLSKFSLLFIFFRWSLYCSEIIKNARLHVRKCIICPLQNKKQHSLSSVLFSEQRS